MFIIGDNPSTPRRDEFDDFNDYWTALTYNIEKFDEAYKSKRLDDRATKTTVQTEKLVDLNREGALPRDKHLLGGYPRLGYDFCSGAALSA
ncbi:hypothetical protein [Caballeronia novacaledonica]|uniref:Uncharacterized protein n=1 Tax=Caballeronia novacaledonica TaxID=1544861 RepID=A0AA37IHH5_9BURK|nr:hypothetical protein [Caballeronia novacaledonica]GJH29302.1 hypothetical protein CBA19CS42_32320 [Caballeronia novacaledonica]